MTASEKPDFHNFYSFKPLYFQSNYIPNILKFTSFSHTIKTPPHISLPLPLCQLSFPPLLLHPHFSPISPILPILSFFSSILFCPRHTLLVICFPPNTSRHTLPATSALLYFQLLILISPSANPSFQKPCAPGTIRFCYQQPPGPQPLSGSISRE